MKGSPLFIAVALSSPPGHGLGQPQARPCGRVRVSGATRSGTCAPGFIGAGLWAIPVRFHQSCTGQPP